MRLFLAFMPLMAMTPSASLSKADEHCAELVPQTDVRSPGANCGTPRPLRGAEIRRLLNGTIIRPAGLVRATGESTENYRRRRRDTATISFEEEFRTSGAWSLDINSAVPRSIQGTWRVRHDELCVNLGKDGTVCRIIRRDSCGNLDALPMPMVRQISRGFIKFDVAPMNIE